MSARRGKIARFPHEVRELLNERLRNGQNGKAVLNWLNGLEEVKAVVAQEFDGEVVSKHNLSHWRNGGYKDWLLLQEAMDRVSGVMEEAEGLKKKSSEPLADKLAVWVVAKYCAVASALPKAGDEMDEVNWKRLRELCHDVVALRRGDNYGERRHLIEGQLELGREKLWKKRSDEFWRWAEDPRVREALEVKYMTEEERIRAVRKIFGMAESNELTREPEETDKDRERRLCEMFGYMDLNGTPTHKYVNGEFVKISEKGEVGSASEESGKNGREGEGGEV